MRLRAVLREDSIRTLLLDFLIPAALRSVGLPAKGGVSSGRAIELGLFDLLMPCRRACGGGGLQIQPAPGIQSPPVVSRPVFSEGDLGLRFAFMRR